MVYQSSGLVYGRGFGQFGGVTGFICCCFVCVEVIINSNKQSPGRGSIPPPLKKQSSVIDHHWLIYYCSFCFD